MFKPNFPLFGSFFPCVAVVNESYLAGESFSQIRRRFFEDANYRPDKSPAIKFFILRGKCNQFCKAGSSFGYSSKLTGNHLTAGGHGFKGCNAGCFRKSIGVGQNCCLLKLTCKFLLSDRTNVFNSVSFFTNII